MKYFYIFCTWYIRGFALLMTWLLYLDLTATSVSPGLRFTPKYLAHTGLYLFSFHIGIWMVTTEWGRRKKLLILLMHVPVAIIADYFAYQYGPVFCLSLFVLLVSYWVLFSSRRDSCVVTNVDYDPSIA